MNIRIGILTQAIGLSVLVLTSACSTTKRLGENDILYTGVKKMTITSVTGGDVPGSVESDVKDPLSVKPNNPLYSPYVRTPLPIGLWAWNYLYTEKNKGIKRWLYRTLAKQPVLISDVKPELRTGLVKDILDNNGYFGSSADYELVGERNPKKSRINYRVDIAEPWTYDTVKFPAVQGPVTRAISDMQASSNVKAGAQYNIDTLTRERIRITNNLREQTYYYFRPDYIEYLADTTRRLNVDLRMVLAKGIPAAALQPYDIGDISVSLFSSQGGGDPDSTVYNGMKIWYQKPRKIRPKILARALTLHPGQPARLSDINTTLTNLTKLGIFRYVNLEVTPLDSLKPGDKMDMKITAAFDQPLEAEFEVDFAHKSSGFIGPGTMFSVKNKNALRGGETFSVRLNGGYEWQTGNSNDGNSLSMNSYEIGINTSLALPRVVAPKFIPRNDYPARTTFNLGADLLRRAGYFSMTSFSFGTSYDFQTSRTSHHNLTLLKFTFNHTFNKTEKFDEFIGDRPVLARNFENQFIPSASYTYVWIKPVGRKKENKIVWGSSVITAGNIFSGIRSLLKQEKPGKIFGTEFSQFVKLISEIRYFKKVGEKNTLATRFYAGAAVPYGNLDILPYVEQFYIGGANSIRAFTIRSIGPGSFIPNKDDNKGYFDQMGEMKLEANVEFRFGLLGDLQGAVFLDAGNIWLLRKDETRPGGEIGEGNFLKSIATGTGAGLRYDLSFLVLRLDVGIGLHLPYDTGKKGYYNIPKFKDGLGVHLAIGYPF